MSVGFNTYQRIKKAEVLANRLGFRFTGPYHRTDRDDIFVLKPLDDEVLPVYPYDMSLFGGELVEVEAFLHGIEWARDYDSKIGLRTVKTRPKAEQRVRNRKLLKLMRQA